MQILRSLELGRAVVAAMMTVALGSTVLAQTTRISRTETDVNELTRRLAPGEIGSLNDTRSKMSIGSTRAVDYDKVDKRALANLLKEALDEAGRLYTSLETDYRRNPQLRPFLSDLKALRIQTNRLSQDMTAGLTIEEIVADFRDLDTDWRLFSHRLSQSSGLSTTSRQSVERIDGIDRQMGKLFQVEPSLDRRELAHQIGILENSLFNMSDELRRDTSGNPKTVQLVSDTRKLQQQVARIEELVIDNSPYERIVSDYNRFERAWTVLFEQLGAINNPYIERAVRRIVDADSLVHELLWIENTTSRVQLKQTADALMRDVDEFYNRTPLKLLLAFRNVSGTLDVANDFYGVVQNFSDNLKENVPDEQLIESYGYIEEQGALFIRTFSQMKSQAAVVVLREIEDGIAALRQELNLGGTVSQVDTRKLLPIAASLENLADNLDYDVRRWLNTERPTYSKEVSAASAAFMKRTQRLHRMLDAEATLPELQREADALYEEWKAVYVYLSRCRTADRENISREAADIRIDLTDLNNLLR